MKFQVTRAEHNEKLAKDNQDYYCQVTTDIQASEAKLQVTINKLELAEEKISELEAELKEKSEDLRNKNRDLERLKRENEQCRKKSGIIYIFSSSRFVRAKVE